MQLKLNYMKRKDLQFFYEGLHHAKFDNPKITYAITKNKRRLQEIIEDLQKSAPQPDEKMQEFLNKREDLAKQYANKDKDGNPLKRVIPVAVGRNMTVYDVPDADNEESPFRKAIKPLQEEYKEDIEAHSKKEEDFEKFLQEESEYVPFMVNLQTFEDEKCPQQIMDLIFWMIDDK
jgi:uncharacterized protein YdiU (UPF0061 family)